MQYIEAAVAVFGIYPALVAGFVYAVAAFGNVVGFVMHRTVSRVLGTATPEQVAASITLPGLGALGGAMAAVGLDHVISEPRNSHLSNVGWWLLDSSPFFLLIAGLIAIWGVNSGKSSVDLQVGLAIRSGSGIDAALKAVAKEIRDLPERPGLPRLWLRCVLAGFLLLALLSDVPPFTFHPWWSPLSCAGLLVVGFVVRLLARRLEWRAHGKTLDHFRQQLQVKAVEVTAFSPSPVAVAPSASSAAVAVPWAALGGLIGLLVGRRTRR